jgi:uncharacterized membrane protein YeiH
VAGVVGFGCAFALRGAAIHWKLGLPGFDGREPPEEA